MACGFTVSSVRTFDSDGVRLTGTYDAAQPCANIEVSVVFPDGRQTAAAVAAMGVWTADFRLADPAQLKQWCEQARPADPTQLSIEVRCLDANGAVTCRHVDTRPLHCCPIARLLAPEIGDCISHQDGALRKYRWSVLIDWPPGYTGTCDLKLRLEQSGNPYEPVIRDVDDISPAAATYTVEAHLRADRDYEGTLSIECGECETRTIAIGKFRVPMCACGSAPNPNAFFTVTDAAGNPIADPNGTGCATGDKVTIKAAQGPVTWTATTFQAPIVVERVDAVTVRVPLPADGTRVIVTATLVVGACEFPISVSVRRCPPPPCIAVPDDYALTVTDANGNPIPDGNCVPGTIADVTAPDHEGGVEWTVDGAAQTADAATPRRLRVTLNDANEHTVTAKVGAGACAKAVSRTIQQCQDGIPTWKDRFWPKLPWCLFLLLIGLFLFFAGHFVSWVAIVVLMLWPCFVDAAVALATWSGGLSILVAIIIYACVILVMLIGFVISLIGIALLVFWFFECFGCVGGAKSPFSFCEMMQFAAWLLGFGSIVAFLIDVAIWACGLVGGVACGIPLGTLGAWIAAGLDCVGIAFDFCGLLIPNLIVYYIGNATGCFTSWPRRFIPIITITLPAELSVRCPDEITPDGA